MKSQSKSIILTAIGGLLCVAQAAFAGPPPQAVPESGASSLGLLALALGGIGLLKILLHGLVKK